MMVMIKPHTCNAMLMIDRRKEGSKSENLFGTTSTQTRLKEEANFT